MGRKSRAQRLAEVVSHLEVIRTEMERLVSDEYDNDERLSLIDPDELSGKALELYNSLASAFIEKMNNQASLIQNYVGDISDIKDELEAWRDGMPENLQGGEKYEQLDSAVGGLEDAIGELENFDDVTDASEAQNAVNELCDIVATLESIEIPRMIG